LYIIPEQKDLKPPINDEETGTVDGEYILYNNKYSNYMTVRDMVCVF
jgi:hypothetical protein